MLRLTKISNFAATTALVFVMKMFFFSAFFLVAGTENIPQNIFEYSHVQYSSTEKLKRNRELNFDEWLEANVTGESVQTFSKKIISSNFNFQTALFISLVKYTINSFFSGHLSETKNLTALLNNRTYLRFQKLLL